MPLSRDSYVRCISWKEKDGAPPERTNNFLLFLCGWNVCWLLAVHLFASALSGAWLHIALLLHEDHGANTSEPVCSCKLLAVLARPATSAGHIFMSNV